VGAVEIIIDADADDVDMTSGDSPSFFKRKQKVINELTAGVAKCSILNYYWPFQT